MPKKRSNRRRAWDLLLAVHLLLYTLAWVMAIYGMLLAPPLYMMDYRNVAVIVLLWLPALAVHVSLYANVARRESPDSERQAYREGFADAMERLADRSYDVSRLTLDDEGELVEVDLPKRKREN